MCMFVGSLRFGLCGPLVGAVWLWWVDLLAERRGVLGDGLASL